MMRYYVICNICSFNESQFCNFIIKRYSNIGNIDLEVINGSVPNNLIGLLVNTEPKSVGPKVFQTTSLQQQPWVR